MDGPGTGTAFRDRTRYMLLVVRFTTDHLTCFCLRKEIVKLCEK